jgi:hypothetical protein
MYELYRVNLTLLFLLQKQLYLFMGAFGIIILTVNEQHFRKQTEVSGDVKLSRIKDEMLGPQEYLER